MFWRLNRSHEFLLTQKAKRCQEASMARNVWYSIMIEIRRHNGIYYQVKGNLP